MNKPVVSICCITYNQEMYIRDAIEGFLIQKTDFPVEIIIHDDASTDKTATIITEYQEKYPDLIFPIYQAENQFSKGIINVLKPLYEAARGKYIALCEGDDYWTDPLKLQKQVDFLETHPECSISCHKIRMKYDSSEKQDYVFPDLEGDRILQKNFLYGNAFIRTCSVVFRNIEIERLVQFLQDFKVGDSPLFYYYAQLGNIGYIDEIMSVYRIHDNSYWSSQLGIDQVIGTLETRIRQKKSLKIYGSKELNSVILQYIIRVIEYYYRSGDQKLMRKYLLMSYQNLSTADSGQLKKIFRYSCKSFLPGFDRHNS